MSSRAYLRTAMRQTDAEGRSPSERLVFSRERSLQSGRRMPLCFVVDDHVDTRDGFAEYLRESGFDVQTAADAGELGRCWPRPCLPPC